MKGPRSLSALVTLRSWVILIRWQAVRNYYSINSEVKMNVIT